MSPAPDTHGPLAGKSIVITRAVHQSGDLKALIEARGGRTLMIPAVEILPPEDWGPCDSAISSIQDYSALVFTSANGVAAFFERLQSHPDRTSAASAALGKKIFAVGARTAGAVHSRGARAVAIPESSTATGLAGLIAAGGGAETKYLFPCGDLSPATVPDAVTRAGGVVDRVVVYRTVKPATPAGTADPALAAAEADCITFTSPSSVRNFLEIVGAADSGRVHARAIVAVIGPTTAEAAALAGMAPDVVAEEQTAAGLVDAICRHFRPHDPGEHP